MSKYRAILISLLAVTVLAIMAGCGADPTPQPAATETTPTAAPVGTTNITPEEARAIARDAYIYGFPMVDSYRIQYSYFVDSSDPEFKAPWNQIRNTPRVYTPEDKAVQTPNSDTPYSHAGLDLRTEPVVLTVPVIDDNRYFSVQLIDSYTHNFAYIGSRATGNDGGSFLIAGPGWEGEKPNGIEEVIQAETNFVLAWYRTQLLNDGDLNNVKRVQDGYQVQTLSQFLGESAPEAAPIIDFLNPLSRDQQVTSPDFFNILNYTLQTGPTHPSEQELMARFAKLNIGPGLTFDAEKLSPELRKAVEDGMADGWAAFAEIKKQVEVGEVASGDVFGTREYLKNNYLNRMAAAVLGIYGNSVQEAMYPAYYVDATGRELDGSKNSYTMRFPPGQLPKVNAFWSLTMYEMPASLLVANPINRYLINSPMLPDLKRDADGSLTLYIQQDSPGEELESNWLPAPNGPFIMIMRLYWPKAEALDGTWTEPPVIKTDGTRITQTGEGNKVTVFNFVRAETDRTLKIYADQGAFGKLLHFRQPQSVDTQPVIRMNRDTLYSAGIFDLTEPVTITLPEPNGRFQSMLIINQDHSIFPTEYGPGTITLTQEKFGTRYVVLAFRTFMNATDPNDIKEANALQDQIKSEQADAGSFEVPDWDEESLGKIRDAINVLAGDITDFSDFFGEKSKMDPLNHLLGTAYGWGANPKEAAVYVSFSPEKNDGTVPYRVTVKDVPVDGFWSITVYNAQGFMEKNDLDAYSYNNFTATPDADGSFTINFGGDPTQQNYIPITKGWNYLVRMYQPQKEILDGSWEFPSPTEAK